jgi:hypothetical protein
MLFTAIMSAELLPVICHKCQHVSMPHLLEQNYTVGTASITAIAVSGISDTATTITLPFFDKDTS